MFFSPDKSRSSVRKEKKSFLKYLGFNIRNNEPSDSDNEGDFEDCIDENITKKNFVTRSKLPEGFSDEVLDLEMKLENEYEQKDVDRLIYLYSQAMEFYEPINKDKYLSFKNRIQKLLVNPKMFNRMKNEQRGRDRCFTDTIRQRPPQLIKINKEAPKCNQGPSKMTSSIAPKKPDQSKSLHISAKMSESVKNMIQDDISAQKASLNKRLVQRKFKGMYNNKLTDEMKSRTTSFDKNMFNDNGFNMTGKFGDLSSINITSEMDSSLTCSTSALANNKSNISSKTATKDDKAFDLYDNNSKSFEDDEKLCEDLANLDFENVKLDA